MDVPNVVKSAAASGQQIRGVHLTFPQLSIIEILAHVELDFIYLDGEHGAFGLPDIEACCIAAERHGILPIARVPDRTASAITSFLDRGVKGIVAPHVDSVKDAAEVVQAIYYAPLGNRSFGGGRPHYGLGIKDRVAHLAEENATTSVCIMVESVGALESVGEIAALEGIDYLSFGLNDLAQALDRPGEPNHPDVKRAVEEASETVRRAGKRVREDFMKFAWINAVLVAGTRKLIG
jgi:2-keto-3-deoxy-L-rhamnonate aldolase RhmA